jgi:hypothetical protein
MYIAVGGCLDTLRAAAACCSLDLLEGDSYFRHDLLRPADVPPWMTLVKGSKFPWPCDHCLRLLPSASNLCPRSPHEVGVYERESRLWLVWDTYRGGFGLTAYIGEYGEFLGTSYVLESLPRLERLLGLDRQKVLLRRGGTRVSLFHGFEGTMGQKRVIIRISPKGEVTVKTEGYTGQECRQATKTLEETLGIVLSDTPTGDMYKPPEQTQSVSQ